MTKNKQKITVILCLLLVALVPPLQATQSIEEDHTTKDGDYKTIVDLFDIKGLGLIVVKYIGCEGKDGYTALRWSVRLGYLDCAKYITQGTTKDKERNSMLHKSAQNGHLACLKYLVEHGADINNQNQNGYTALHLSADNGHLKVVKYLVQKGADINAKDFFGYTALHSCAEKGHLEALKYLVQKGADINAKSFWGKTALHSSAKKGHFDCVKFLVQQGANISTKTPGFYYEKAHPPLDYSLNRKHVDCSAYLV